MKKSLIANIILLQETFESIEFINIKSKRYLTNIEIGITNQYGSYEKISKMIVDWLKEDISIITFIHL